MKNKILLFFLLIIASSSVSTMNAQLKVSENGNVGIHLNSSITPASMLAIGDSGAHNTSVYVLKNALNSSGIHYGLYSKTTNQTGNATLYAIYGTATGMAKSRIGVAGEVNAGTNSSFKTYGVFGSAGASGTTPKYNYGVYGLLKEAASGQSGSGAGIYGANESTLSLISGSYAGFFKGQTKVNGDFYATTVTQTSDARLKTNIKPINEDALYQIAALRPVEFNWQQVEKTFTDDTITIKEDFFSKDTDFDRKHYGFIAQDIQKLFPNLVKEDEEGYLSVNYIELIPLLVKTIQDQESRIDGLERTIETLTSQTTSRKASQKSDNDNIIAKAVLYQNTPNPFAQDTRIAYDLPIDTHDATLYIYDANGLQLESYPIRDLGTNSITISGGHLPAGMYLYSLIADGQIVDTKRMILTK